MVLKLKLCLFICLFTLPALAQVRVTDESKRIFALAKEAYVQQRYGDTISLLNRGFNLKDDSTPGGAIVLAAYAYEKLKQWSNAQKIYSYLIERRYREANNTLIYSYKSSDGVDLPEAPKRLYHYYHRRAESLTQIYLNRYKAMSPRLRNLYKKSALMYVGILEDSEYDDDSYYSIPERFEKYDGEIRASIYRSGWFLNSSYISWRDKINLVFPSGKTSTIESTGEGLCLGGGWRYENEYFEFNLNGCYAAASMTVGKEDSTLRYFQKGVASNALIAGPSILWKPKSKGASFGVNLPFVYRSGDYTEPENYTLENATIFTYGYLLEGGWRFTNWGFFTKFGKIKRLSSSIWMLGTQYSF